jgi:membrane-anchored protein YejM (alkaline phosphatase superfamily)
MHRGDLGSLDGWVSLGSSRMEAGTEDRAALPTIFKFMEANKRSFVLHELVFGHSPEWRAATGKTQLAYYDLYLNDILNHLEAKGQDSHTLLIIVSDHGERVKASSMENYRVPLLVVGNGVRPLMDNGFRSHLDMQAIVAHYLAGTDLPSSQEELFVVGSSERWIYGQISKNGEHVFIEDRTGRIISQQGNRDPMQIYRLFQAAVDKFGSSYGK